MFKMGSAPNPEGQGWLDEKTEQGSENATPVTDLVAAS